MGDSLDIQNLLQAGYFTTSRAKTSREPSPISESRPYILPPPSQDLASSRTYQTTLRPRRAYPPPPSVEDEEASLDREHVPSRRPWRDEEPPSRGDFEQQPIIMEVHEYNPERRFVILTGSPNGSDDSESEKKSDSAEPAPTRQPRTERPVNEGRYEPSTRQGRDSKLKPSSSPKRGSSRPPLEKRRSRQDLPRLDTEFQEDRPSDDQRNRPSTARVENPSARMPKPSDEPDTARNGPAGRDKINHGYSKTQGSANRSPTQRTYASYPDSRRYDDSYARSSSTPTASKRNLETPSSARPISSERTADSRDRGGYSSSRNNRKEPSPSYARPEREDTGRSSKYTSSRESTMRREDIRSGDASTARREDARLGDDHPKGPRELQPRRRKSIVHQEGREGRESLGTAEKPEGPAGPRLRPKGPSMPVLVPIPMSMGSTSGDASMNPRNSSTFPITKDEKIPREPLSKDIPPREPLPREPLPREPGPREPPSREPLPRELPREPIERPKSQLPYPVDDDPLLDPFDARSFGQGPARPRYDPEPSVSMPDLPQSTMEPGYETRSTTDLPSVRAPGPTQASWQPPQFSPTRDGVHLGRPVGSFRRYSENVEAPNIPRFPECPRKHPVAGKVDWLTLPRTDFNICPECYGAVFADTEYRTLFQPMLRSATMAISCDFGVFPWFRIAWLLTLKNKIPNLQLFHDISAVLSATHDLPCPGDRVTKRNWMTIWNPATRRPVYDFTICSQCAGVIQALLPNMSNIFVPLDPRNEPTRGSCAMRFKPKRKRFVMYFDAMELTSDQALQDREEPDVHTLAKELEQMASTTECHEDRPIKGEYWFTMQYLPKFSVCGECYDEVVRPLNQDDNVVARNFFRKPQLLPMANCQLYSPRMRDIFNKACRWNDPQYLESKVQERADVEKMIQEKLALVEASNRDQGWKDEEIDNLIHEWKMWE